jgi:hypothetical protein
MPHTNKASAPVSLDIPELEGRYVDLGGYTVGFETYKADVDPAEFFRGLPDDRCQCPHWGVVLTEASASGSPATPRPTRPVTPTTHRPGTRRS